MQKELVQLRETRKRRKHGTLTKFNAVGELTSALKKGKGIRAIGFGVAGFWGLGTTLWCGVIRWIHLSTGLLDDMLAAGGLD